MDEADSHQPGLSIETLELINAEITASLERQVDSGKSVDNKSIVIVGYAIAASSFLSTRHTQIAFTIAGYLFYAAAAGFGISAYSVRIYLDAPTPSHLFKSYLSRTKLETLAALSATRAHVYESNSAKYKRKAQKWSISLLSLLAGAFAMILALVGAHWHL